MPSLLDLPPELRLKIFAGLPVSRKPYWQVAQDHPAISRVNRQLRQESLSQFYRNYRWPFFISIADDGSMAVMERGTILYLQRMERAGHLWRVQRIRIQYAFPAIHSYQSISDHFDARYPKRKCFYDTFCNILRRAPNLRNVEFFIHGLVREQPHLLVSPACLQPLALMPKMCDYQVKQWFPDKEISELFVNCLEDATGKTLVSWLTRPDNQEGSLMVPRWREIPRAA